MEWSISGGDRLERLCCIHKQQYMHTCMSVDHDILHSAFKGPMHPITRSARVHLATAATR